MINYIVDNKDEDSLIIEVYNFKTISNNSSVSLLITGVQNSNDCNSSPVDIFIISLNALG